MTKGWNDITFMQDMTSVICRDSEDSKVLIDKRDGKPYVVAKLKDGNCWMTQNLGIINKTISYTDSDMTSGSFTIPVSSLSGFSTSDQYQSKAYYEASYGGYYNWYTATAGAGISGVSSGTLTQSICPKGWKLPPNTGSGSYNTLFTSYGTYQNGTLFYGTQSIIAPPLSFTYGGYIGDDTLHGVDNDGRYWSATAMDSSYAYNLIFGTNIFSANYFSRSRGCSVRCVAR